MADKWTVQRDGEEWTVTTDGDSVTVTHLRAPFGLPISRVRISCASAVEVSKLIKKAADMTKPPRASSRRGESR